MQQFESARGKCVFSGAGRVQSPPGCGSNHSRKISELVAMGGKRMRNLMGFGSGCAVESAGLWGSAQPNKWTWARLARAFCDSGWLPENSIWGRNVNIVFSSSATAWFQHLCCILHMDWDEKYCDTNPSCSVLQSYHIWAPHLIANNKNKLQTKSCSF